MKRSNVTTAKKSGILILSTIVGVCAFVHAPKASAQPIDLVLNLKPRVSMMSLAVSVTNPGSPRFHNFFTPQEIRQIAAPPLDQLRAMQQALAAAQIQIVSVSPTNLSLRVRGEGANLERVFGAKLQYDSTARLHRSVTPITIPPSLPLVASVTGFDNSKRRHPKWHAMAQAVSAAPKGALPEIIRSHYGFDDLYKAGINGGGQHIAIATYGAFHPEDVAQYFVQSKITPAPSVDVVAFAGQAPLDPESAVETQADAELSGMIAPGAAIHVFTGPDNSDAGEVQLFTAILDDGRAKVVNYSWGTCEKDVAPQHKQDMDNIFARAVAQGVNIMIASGDSGSAGCVNDPATIADYPASSPYVVAVGGTTLVPQKTEPMARRPGPAAPGGLVLNEVGWSGSGGGISKFYPAPAWQKALNIKGRGAPDISFNADPHSGEPILIHDPQSGQVGFISIGGTSIAAPQWTGFLALVGQARRGKPIGALAPVLYAIPGPQMGTFFHDITEGSNGEFKAGPGWDAVTGLGSPIAGPLLKYLSETL